MHSLHYYHARNFHKFFHTDMWRFDLSIWLHIIARSAISIFIPIFLLEIGYSLVNIIVFYMLYMVVDLPMNFFAAKLIQKIGGRKVYLIGTVAIITFFYGFSQLELNQWFLIGLLIFLLAVYDSFYWVSHIYLFEKVSHKLKSIAKGTGLLYAVKYFAGMLGPAAGALILIFSDYKGLIFFSIFVFVLSAIPLFRMKLVHEKPASEERLLPVRKFFSKKAERQNYLTRALFAFHTANESVIWPIFIYFTFASLESVAFVPIIISTTSIIFSYIAGKLATRKREKIIALSAALIALVWVVRMLVDSASLYYASIFAVGFLALFLRVAMYSNVFDRGREIGFLSAATYNNAISMFAQFFLYLLLFLAVSVFDLSFSVAALALFVLSLFNAMFFLSKAKKV